MIIRFDHAVIAVRDLDEASERFRAIGFDVRRGGQHTGLGTHNALIRFEVGYLELISVHDAEGARVRGLGGRILVDRLERGEEGLVGFALAVDEIETHAEAIQRLAPGSVGPLAMTRLTPERETLSWRLVIPGGTPWLKPWPFLIQWDAESAGRSSAGTHQNAVTGVLAVDVNVAAPDLALAPRLYGEALGLPRDDDGSFWLGRFSMRLHAGAAPSEAAAVVLSVESVDEAAAVIVASGLFVQRHDDELRIESGWAPLDQLRFKPA